MRRYITALLFLFCCVFTQAQYKIVLHLSDGSTIDKEVWEVDSIGFEVSDDTITSPLVLRPVDLGLSVKWANANFGVGDNNSIDSTLVGYLVGWGDVTGRNYSQDLKYFPTKTAPTSIVADTRYDIVTKSWGGDWRLPTKKEIEALVDSCKWEKQEKGFLVTGPNGNKIFLPFTGKRIGAAEATNTTEGYYWSGEVSDYNAKAYNLYLGDTEAVDSVERYIGLAVRPVYGKYKPGVQLVESSISNITRSSASLYMKITGDFVYATKAGVRWGLSTDALTSSSEQDISSSGEMAFNLTDLTENTTYYYVMYAIYDGKEVILGSGSFTTLAKYPVANKVDLGLSVMWATWNVGATSELETGGYYGWGDATGDLLNNFNDYYFGTGNTASSISGNASYDIATANWKDKWRLPTREEMEELNSLTWEHTSDYEGTGLTGYIVTGKKLSDGTQNKIFFPAAGYWAASSTGSTTGTAYSTQTAMYWTADYDLTNDRAYYVTLLPENVTAGRTYRATHILVRPVWGTSEDLNPTPEEKEGAGTGVDLGLSVTWADRNVGASTSTEYGGYFGWGEVEARTGSFGLSDYPYYNATTQQYDTLAYDIKSTEYDAATVNWGGTWRMPTSTEMAELRDLCTWTWDSSRNGYVVTGTNGNSIFLPSGGYKNGSNSYYEQTRGAYWSSTLYTRNDDSYNVWADYMLTSSSDYFISSNYRYYGCNIRPVKGK